MSVIKKFFSKILSNDKFVFSINDDQIYLELCFLIREDERLPVDKMIKLASNQKLGIDNNYWEIWDEYPFEKGKELASNMNQKRFCSQNHTIFSDQESVTEKYLIFGRTAAFVPPAPYLIRMKTNLENLSMEVFEELMTDPEFVCAYCLSETDEYIQHATSVQNYNTRGLPFDKKRVIKSNDKYTPDEIDIAGNPGISRQVPNMILRSCWRMWFSENYFEVVPKEKIENFEGAKVNTILENGLHFIELYESPFDAAKPESRAIQKKFNEWIDIEGVYKEHSEKYYEQFK